MNLFRLAGDLLHLLSIIMLIYSIRKKQSVAGISLRMQETYVIVFCTRYLDLFFRFHSIYNTTMKVFFIASSIYTVVLIAKTYRSTYSGPENDWFGKKFLLLIPILPTILLTQSYSPWKILWTYSLWLEAIAIFPQQLLLRRVGKAEAITKWYMACMGLYRFFYILNWIYRYYMTRYFFLNAWLAGIVQTALYSDFLFIFITKVLTGRQYDLPFDDK